MVDDENALIVGSYECMQSWSVVCEKEGSSEVYEISFEDSEGNKFVGIGKIFYEFVSTSC